MTEGITSINAKRKPERQTEFKITFALKIFDNPDWKWSCVLMMLKSEGNRNVNS